MRTVLRRGAAVLLGGGVALSGAGLPAQSAPGAPVPAAEAGKVTGWSSESVVGTVPETVAGATLRAVDAGSYFSLGVTTDGEVRAWGRDANPALNVPAGLTGVSAVSAGASNALALKSDGTVVAWGDPSAGLNDVPADLGTATDAEMAGGLAAAVTGGTVRVWGAAAVGAQPPEGLTGVTDVEGGAAHLLALKSDGTVETWGPTAPMVPIPAEVQGRVTQIAAGSMNSAAVLDDGTVAVWGTLAGTTPPAGLAGERVVEVDVDSAIVARTASGKVFAWGGAGPDAESVHAVPASLTGAPVVAIAAGTNHALALTTSLRAMTDPAITGTPKVGETLSLTAATFNLDPESVTTQWYTGAGESAEPIAGATGATLALTDAQVGKTVSVRQTAVRGTETLTATSAATAPVAANLAASSLRATSAASRYGTAARVTVSVTPATATGPVEIRRGSTVLARGTVAAGRATLSLPATGLRPGRHALSVRYAGDGATAASTGSLTQVVAKAATRTTAKAKTRKIIAKRTRAVLVVTVRATGTTPTGKVTVLQGRKKVGKATVKRGKARVKLARLAKPGRARLTVKYAGSPLAAASRTSLTVRVARR